MGTKSSAVGLPAFDAEGQWEAVAVNDLEWEVKSGDYIIACCAGYVGEEDSAVRRACLIAAAPELLTSLQSLVASLAEQDDEGLIEHADSMQAARAAIAKATGGAQ